LNLSLYYTNLMDIVNADLEYAMKLLKIIRRLL